MSLRASLHLQKDDFLLGAEFELPARGVTALFGRSGSGKSLTLRCLAGLERAAGRVQLGDERWQDDEAGLFLLPHLRAVGYVPQSAALFPHLSVKANIEYGWRRTDPAARPIHPNDAIDWLGIGHLLERFPGKLSGGERQRVAIARALLTNPGLLLLDEPLSALDRQGKQEIMPYLETLAAHLEVPVVYVSHALDEVERLADWMVLLEQGRVSASGPLGELVGRLDLPLARREDAGAVIRARVIEHDEHYQLTQLAFDGGHILVGRLDHAPGEAVRVRIQARDVSLALQPPEASSILNILPAVVSEVAEESPSRCLVKLDVGGAVLLSRITHRSRETLGIEPGLSLYAQVKSVALV